MFRKDVTRMGLVNKLQSLNEDQMAVSQKSSNDIVSETKRNLKESIVLLSQDFLKQVQNKEIKINDIRDVKDLATILQTIDNDGQSNEAIPQVSAELANFYNVELNLPQTGNTPNPTEVVKQVNQLDEDAVSRMIAQHTEELNKANANPEGEDDGEY